MPAASAIFGKTGRIVMGLILVSLLTGAALCIMVISLMFRPNASGGRKLTREEIKI